MARTDHPPGATARLRTADALDTQMRHAGLGPVALATRINARYRHGQRVSHQYLSRLRDPHNRATRSCTPDLARRIAAELGLAVELLFVMPAASDPVAHIAHPGAPRVSQGVAS